jgi:hypothetical protein
MSVKTRNAEKGQILYIVVIAMVAIMGFTAFAIDGANIYRQRRADQSAVDSASLAGAGRMTQYLKTAATTSYTCGSGAIFNGAAAAAQSGVQWSATANGYDLEPNDLSTGQGFQITCGSSNGVPYIDIHAMITSTVDTYFLKMITRQPTKSTVDSIARVFINTSYANGNALVSMSTGCGQGGGGGIHAIQNGQVTVKNGGIYSTTCFEATGSSKILDYDGIIQYNTSVAEDYSALILGDPNSSAAPNITSVTPESAQDPSLYPGKATQTLTPVKIPAMTAFSAPSCGSYKGNYSAAGGGDTLNPGTYSNLTWSSWGSGNLKFNPGVYCITSSLSFSGGGGSATAIMDGVTFYFANGAGGLTIGGNGLKYSMKNSTVYIENGTFTINNTLPITSSKVYIGKGDFVVGGSAVVTMDNSSINLHNGSFSVGAGGTFNSNNITIYVLQGNFTLDGGATVSIFAPGCNTSACGVGPAIPGVLLFMDPTNTHTVSIDNGSGVPHYMNGTIYAPTSYVKLAGGTSTSTINVQLIANSIDVISGAQLTMDVLNARLYTQGSTVIDLLK